MSTTEQKLPDWALRTEAITALVTQGRTPEVALQEFGIAEFQAEHNDLAIKAFTAAIALNPKHAVYLNNLAVALNAAGDREGAIKAFHTSLDLDKDQPQIWLNLAYTVRELGRLDEAEQALVQASGRLETAGEALSALGMLELERGNSAKAGEWLARAVKTTPGTATLHAALGAALFQTGKPGEAAAEYLIAVSLSPKESGYRTNADFLIMLNGVLTGNAEEAIATFARPLTDDEILRSAFDRALSFLVSFDHKPQAKALLVEWRQYYPDDAESLYFQQIFTRKSPARAPAAYIAQHFDRLADTLNEKFLASIQYRVPEEMAALLSEKTGQKKWQGDILDAGCGTGASGAALKKFAARLTAIDLSPRMTKLAKASKLYDDVRIADILDFLQKRQTIYDLIVAADALIYFGPLEDIFQAAHSNLSSGGLLMFNVETNHNEMPYELMTNGRFRHAKAYVMAAGEENFKLLGSKDLVLRMQGNKPVQGTIFLFRKV